MVFLIKENLFLHNSQNFTDNNFGEILKKKLFYILSSILLLLMAVTIYSVDLPSIFALPNSFYLNLEEINETNKNNRFGAFVDLVAGEETKVSNDKAGERVVTFKLFGIIPIRKIVAKILPEEEVYVGGNPIGIFITTNNGIVVGQSEFGKEFEIGNSLKAGDVITKIDGKCVEGIDDISSILEKDKRENTEIEFVRNNRSSTRKLLKKKDKEGKYKLGLTVKDDICGIGTLTFVNTKTKQFGSLGHPICENAEQIKLSSGTIYDCKLLGIEKGEPNNPGQLKGVFVEGKNIKGEIEKSNRFGIYGKIQDLSLLDTNKRAMLGGRLTVSAGKAKIISSVSGIREEYDIEIIKTYNQNSEKDKSFVFRVTDKKLLNLTGGIVQGMSGSPIMQNGKIVGAITHVFTADPTKGYGIYTDWMICNNS